MNEIYREIYLVNDRRVEPILLAENSRVPIRLKVMDMELTGSTAQVYAYNSKTREYLQNTTPAAITDGEVLIIPDDGLFLAGNDKLQVHFPAATGGIITMAYPVICAKDYSTGGETPKAEAVKPLIERAEQAAAEAARVKATIPEDYTTLSNDVNTLKNDLSAITDGDIYISNDRIGLRELENIHENREINIQTISNLDGNTDTNIRFTSKYYEQHGGTVFNNVRLSGKFHVTEDCYFVMRGQVGSKTVPFFTANTYKKGKEYTIDSTIDLSDGGRSGDVAIFLYAKPTNGNIVFVDLKVTLQNSVTQVLTSLETVRLTGSSIITVEKIDKKGYAYFDDVNDLRKEEENAVNIFRVTSDYYGHSNGLTLTYDKDNDLWHIQGMSTTTAQFNPPFNFTNIVGIRAFYTIDKALPMNIQFVHPNVNGVTITAGSTSNYIAASISPSILYVTATNSPVDIYFRIWVTYYGVIPYNPPIEYVSTLKDKKLTGKTVYVFGDSISDTYSSSGKSMRYPAYLKDICGVEQTNYAVYSSGFCLNCNNQHPVWGEENTKIPNMVLRASDTIPDYILIAGGTNDWDFDIPLGTASDMMLDNNTFYSGVGKTIRELIIKYPTAKILFVTPLPRWQSNGANTNHTPNLNGNTLVEFADAIIEVCNYYSIPVLDMQRNSNIHIESENARTLYTEDGLHPTALYAYTVYAPMVAKKLESI